MKYFILVLALFICVPAFAVEYKVTLTDEQDAVLKQIALQKSIVPITNAELVQKMVSDPLNQYIGQLYMREFNKKTLAEKRGICPAVAEALVLKVDNE